MNHQKNIVESFFGVALSKQTYLNILYLLISFPLGIFYFVYFVTGISLGIGLAVIFIGLPILAFMIWSAKGLMRFERLMAEAMLGIHVDEPAYYNTGSNSAARRFLLELGNPDNWKSIIYLLMKFALGIFSFTVCVSLISVSLALFLSPLILQIIMSNVGPDAYFYYTSPFSYIGFTMTPFQESLVFMTIGFFLSIITLHITNLITYVSAKLLYFMSPVVRRIQSIS